MTTIRKAEIADADYLAPLLRPADLLEIEATLGPGADVREVLRVSVKYSDPCLVGLDPKTGKPILVAGVVPDLEHNNPKVGTVWMLGTPEIESYPVKFTRWGRKVVGLFHEKYSLLHNFVDARNDVHIKWLRLLGFVFISIKKRGPQQSRFFEFVRLQCA